LCQHGDRRVARLKDGKFETLADKYMGKRLNSPNDLVFARNGDLYFTDPPYGLPGDVNDPKNPNKELDFQGVYKLTPKGEHTLLGRIVTNDKTANCAWGDDGSVLYLATNDKLTRVKTTTKGLGF